MAQKTADKKSVQAKTTEKKDERTIQPKAVQSKKDEESSHQVKSDSIEKTKKTVSKRGILAFVLFMIAWCINVWEMLAYFIPIEKILQHCVRKDNSIYCEPHRIVWIFGIFFCLMAILSVALDSFIKLKKRFVVRSGYFYGFALVNLIWVGVLVYMVKVTAVNEAEEYSHHEVYYDKPIIYLYPEETTDVTVKVGYPNKLTHTYPKYQDGWQVTAEPNGNLKDQSGRRYYALYWEGKDTNNQPRPRDGFVVKGEDTISFLEEKLPLLGLNEREANEFIVYWLPKLESEKYNLIRFETVAEQDENMPLYITPKPDTVIRVMMQYDDLDQPIQVKEQILPPTPKRTGFTVVEWGGTELD